MNNTKRTNTYITFIQWPWPFSTGFIFPSLEHSHNKLLGISTKFSDNVFQINHFTYMYSKYNVNSKYLHDYFEFSSELFLAGTSRFLCYHQYCSNYVFQTEAFQGSHVWRGWWWGRGTTWESWHYTLKQTTLEELCYGIIISMSATAGLQLKLRNMPYLCQISITRITCTGYKMDYLKRHSERLHITCIN